MKIQEYANIEYWQETLDQLRAKAIAHKHEFGDAICDLFDGDLKPHCKSPGCFSGWLAITQPKLLGENLVDGESFYNFLKVKNNFLSKILNAKFYEGFNDINDLFFNRLKELSAFWPNKHFTRAFCNSRAYDPLAKDSCVPIDMVIDVWQECLNNVKNNTPRK